MCLLDVPRGTSSKLFLGWSVEMFISEWFELPAPDYSGLILLPYLFSDTIAKARVSSRMECGDPQYFLQAAPQERLLRSQWGATYDNFPFLSLRSFISKPKGRNEW